MDKLKINSNITLFKKSLKKDDIIIMKVNINNEDFGLLDVENSFNNLKNYFPDHKIICVLEDFIDIDTKKDEGE